MGGGARDVARREPLLQPSAHQYSASYGNGSRPPVVHLETFAGLKLLHKPVDFVIIPDSPHSLVRPWHRMASQGGSVDWFRFWLQGYEDPDPSKATQYARWHELRDQRDQTTHVQ